MVNTGDNAYSYSVIMEILFKKRKKREVETANAYLVL